MGKSQNPVEAHRRKQRQKEIKKNKEKRIHERDDRVKKTKTVGEIKAEIKDFEKRHKGQLQQHEVKSKLDRLKKELKLVQQYEDERKKDPNQRPKANYASSNDRKFVKLERPEMSIYYDPQYNPYGAPPPGKPMLFHRYGGGVTMDIKEAIVPGEALPPQVNIATAPPPPPPPSQNSSLNNNNKQQTQQQAYHGKQTIQKQAPHHEPPPPSQPAKESSSAPAPPPPPPPKKGEEKEELPKIDKNVLPDLPAPSESVMRTRRRQKGLVADIWASSDEVAYERATGIDLEDTSSNLKQVEEEKDEWFYIDTAGNIQGPFPTQHMQSWHAMGYFPPNIRVKKTGRHTDYVAVGTLGAQPFAEKQPEKKKKKKKKKKDRQQKNDEEDAAVQARIASLKGEAENKTAAAEEPEEPDENTVQGRIAALRQAKVQEKEQPKESEEEDAVQARIAALKKGSEQEKDQAETETNSVLARIAALKKEKEEENANEKEVNEADPSVQDRIAALRDQERQSNTEGEGDTNRVSVLNQEKDGVVEESEQIESATGPTLPSEPAAYPLPDEEEAAVAVASYPVDDEEEPSGVAPYSVDDAAAAYPVDDSYPDAAYPVDDAYPATDAYPVDDAAYPVTDSYPVTDEYPLDEAYPVDDSYPVTDAYPVASEDPNIPPAYPTDVIEPATEGTGSGEPVKKKAKVDKAVVSLLPSHLQKKRLHK